MQIIDIVETYRELDADLTDLYLSSLSNRLNEVMKVLTIIATIFMPLSFIASVYGMNFNTQLSPWNMPELNWHYGYPFVWGVMIVVGRGHVRVLPLDALGRAEQRGTPGSRGPMSLREDHGKRSNISGKPTVDAMPAKKGPSASSSTRRQRPAVS